MDWGVVYSFGPGDFVTGAAISAAEEQRRREQRRRAATAREREAEEEHETPTEAETAVKAEGVCCPLFQLQDDFLLNARTGEVWKYDSNSNSFKLVDREKPDLLNSIMAVLVTDFIYVLEDEKTKESAKRLPWARKEYENSFDAVIKSLKVKQKELVPSTRSRRR